MPILVTPIAGALSDRIGSRPLLVSGMALMSGALVWLSAVMSPAVPYVDLIGPFAMAGLGMSLFFAPAANVVLSAVRREDEGAASGVSNTIREVGGVFGVAALATVFASAGGYASPAAFVNGLTAAVWVGAIVLGLGAIAALAIPGRGSRDGRGRLGRRPARLARGEAQA
jgi:MFS family permease